MVNDSIKPYGEVFHESGRIKIVALELLRENLDLLRSLTWGNEKGPHLVDNV